MSHNNGRHLAGSLLRQIVPAAQLDAVLGLEFDVLAHGHISSHYGYGATVASMSMRREPSFDGGVATTMKMRRLTDLPLGEEAL